MTRLERESALAGCFPRGASGRNSPQPAVMVTIRDLRGTCRENAAQDPSEFPLTPLSHHSPGEVAREKEPGDRRAWPVGAGLGLEPKAGVALRAGSNLEVTAEQESSQAAGRKARALFHPQTNGFPWRGPASIRSPGATRREASRACETPTRGNDSKPCSAPALEGARGILSPWPKVRSWPGFSFLEVLGRRR